MRGVKGEDAFCERDRQFESPFLQQRVGNAISFLHLCGARTGELIRVSRSLTSAKYRDPLHLDQHFRTCETSDGNQRTRRKIIAEDLLSQLSKAVTIAGVGDEHSHRDHISQGAAGLLEGLTEPGKYLADLPVKIAGKRFAGRIYRADLPGQPDDPAAFSDDRL